MLTAPLRAREYRHSLSTDVPKLVPRSRVQYAEYHVPSSTRRLILIILSFARLQIVCLFTDTLSLVRLTIETMSLIQLLIETL